MVYQRIGVGEVPFKCALQRGNGLLINAQQQFRGGWSRQDFVEEKFEACVRHDFETERWLAHFAHAFAQRGDMLRAIVSVQAEGHFQFINRDCSNSADKYFVQPAQTPMQPFDAGNDLFHR